MGHQGGLAASLRGSLQVPGDDVGDSLGRMVGEEARKYPVFCNSFPNPPQLRGYSSQLIMKLGSVNYGPRAKSSLSVL